MNIHFIRLTYAKAGHTLWINVHHIQYFFPSTTYPGGSGIAFRDGEAHVKESPDQIVDLLKAAGAGRKHS